MKELEVIFDLTPESNRWKDRELLQDVYVYDIDSLLRSLDNFNISFLGHGYYGVVFRLQYRPHNIDITLKIMRYQTPINSGDLELLFLYSGIRHTRKEIEKGLLTDHRNRSSRETSELAIFQTAGHILGNLVAPQYIDSPICLWVRRDNHNLYQAVGYSLPYVGGQIVRISDNPELTAVANKIEGQYNLFVGARGKTGIGDAKNALLLPSGEKRFIDVQLANTKDFSIPVIEDVNDHLNS